MAFKKRRPWATQPQEGAELDSTLGYEFGTALDGAHPLTLDGRPITYSGGITRELIQENMAFVGDNTNNCAHATADRPFVFGTDTLMTFIVVFRTRASGATDNTIAGFGSSSGSSGNTLFRLTGGSSSGRIRLQAQDGTGSLAYNTNSNTNVNLNDLRWHCAVVAFDLAVGGTLDYYIDGIHCGSASRSGGSAQAATTFQFVNVCGSIRNGAVITPGNWDVALFVPVYAKLSGDVASAISAAPWRLFTPRSIPIGAAGGGPTPVTATTSLSAAIQLARTAAASINAAIQAGRSATASADAAVQVARSTQAALDAAILLARSTSTGISAAVQAGQSATASINAYVQAGSTTSASVDAAIQAPRTGSATLDAAVQQARSATASLAAAVQEARSAAASVNAYIQAGTSAVASVDAAVQASHSAQASLNAAIATARTASLSLGAAIALQLSVGAAVSAAVQAARVATASVGAYIFDESVVVIRYPSRTRHIYTERLQRSVTTQRLPRSITPS